MSSHDTIESIPNQHARVVMHTLASLVRGESLPAFASEGFDRISEALRTAAREADDETLRKMGAAAIVLAFEPLQASLCLERMLLQQQLAKAKKDAG